LKVCLIWGNVYYLQEGTIIIEYIMIVVIGTIGSVTQKKKKTWNEITRRGTTTSFAIVKYETLKCNNAGLYLACL